MDSWLFSDLPAEARELLANAAERRIVPTGEIILREGQPASALYIVASGEVQVVGRDAHGQHQILALIGEGDSFGELSLLTGEPASATVETVCETELWTVDHEQFAFAVDKHPEILRNVARILGERLRQANRRYLRKIRGRLTCFFGQEASVWRVLAAYHIGRSMARHSRRPTVFVDLSGTIDDVAEISAGVRPFRDVVSAAYRIPDDTPGEPVLCYSEPGEAEQLLASVHGLQEHAAEVLVYVPLGHPDEEAVLERADALFAILHESETHHSNPTGVTRQQTKKAAEAVVVSERQTELSLRVQARCQAALGQGTRVRGVVPGGKDSLARPDLQSTFAREAVDRLARSLTGLTVGLALGGGGAKGYAHIGVLNVLREANVPIDYYAGCSIGSPMAVAMAAGWSVEDIRSQLDKISRKAVRPTFPLSSLLASRGIRAELHGIVEDMEFEDLSVSAGVVAVCIDTGEELLLRHGSVWKALMASMAYPGIYEPVQIGSRYLVDGGLLNPVPVSAALTMGADVVISSSLAFNVDEAGVNGDTRRPLILRTLTRSIEIMQSRIGAQSGARADVEILPEFTDRPGLLDFKRGKQLEEAGERGAIAALPRLRSALPWLA